MTLGDDVVGSRGIRLSTSPSGLQCRDVSNESTSPKCHFYKGKLAQDAKLHRRGVSCKPRPCPVKEQVKRVQEPNPVHVSC